MTSRAFPRPSRDFDLDVHDVHVWRFSLTASRERVVQFERILSPDEHRRTSRFHTARLARRFIVARGVLRSLLGRYTRREPGSLEFHYGHAGKPELPASSSGIQLGFNLAHSGSFMLVAVARERHIGIDLEAVRAVPELDRIAQRYFSARENRELRALPPNVRRDSFFRGWTRKEAVAKALGAGLHHAMDRIEVPLAPLEDVIVVRLPGGAPAFALQQVHAGTGYAAAVAVETRHHHETRTTLHDLGAAWAIRPGQ